MSLGQKREANMLIYQKVQKRFFTSIEDFINNPIKYLNIVKGVSMMDRRVGESVLINYFLVVLPLRKLGKHRQQELVEQLFRGEQIGCVGV